MVPRTLYTRHAAVPEVTAMSRTAWPAVVGALLCVAAGCLPGSTRPPATAPPSGDVLTARGSVPVVAAALEEALAAEGIAAVEKRQGPEVRLVGVTRSGGAFALRLTPVSSGGRDRTAVAV